MILIDEKTKTIDGYSYHVIVTRGTPYDPGSFKELPDRNKVYLTTYVVDEVNGLTHDYQVFEFSDYLEKLDI